MKVAVYGAGGIGGYFGGRLSKAGADVHLIARGDHLEELQNHGLRVESVHGDFAADLSATKDPADIGPCDYVLFCVKSYDTTKVARQLDPLIDDTAVISLQNGVTNEERIATEIGRDHVVGGVAYIFSTIREPGTIEHTGSPARIIFGELDGSPTDQVERFLEYCERADGMEGVLSEDIWHELWSKYTFICAQSGVTAAIRLPIGEIREVEASWELFTDILYEVANVAAAEGVIISEETLDEWIDFAHDVDPGAYSSLHYDMTHGKRMELEALHGTVVRKADEHGVDVPATRAVYEILRPWQVRNEA